MHVFTGCVEYTFIGAILFVSASHLSLTHLINRLCRILRAPIWNTPAQLLFSESLPAFFASRLIGSSFFSIFSLIFDCFSILSRLSIKSLFVFSDIYIYINDQWPKPGILGAFVAEIGYRSRSVTATTPGGHLSDQRRPPPHDGHIFAG